MTEIHGSEHGRRTGDAFDDFVRQWGHDCFVVGHQLVIESRFFGPDLDDTIAMASLAQNHLGHLRLLYERVGVGEDMLDPLLYESPMHELLSCQLADAWDPEDWSAVVAKGYMYNTANHLRERLVATVTPDWEAVQGILSRETSLAIRFWSESLRELASFPGGRRRARAAFEALAPSVPDLFYFPGFEKLDQRKRAVGDHSAQLDRWHGDVTSHLTELELPALTEVISLSELRHRASAIHAGTHPSGRRGQHPPELARMLEEARSEYRTEPGWVRG